MFLWRPHGSDTIQPLHIYSLYDQIINNKLLLNVIIHLDTLSVKIAQWLSVRYQNKVTSPLNKVTSPLYITLHIDFTSKEIHIYISHSESLTPPHHIQEPQWSLWSRLVRSPAASPSLITCTPRYSSNCPGFISHKIKARLESDGFDSFLFSLVWVMGVLYPQSPLHGGWVILR